MDIDATSSRLRVRPQHGCKARGPLLLAALLIAGLAPPSTPDSRAGGLLDGLGARLESIDPAFAGAAAPALAAWIRRSRAAAIAAGVAPLPAGVRAALSGHVPGDVLESVRWCRDCGDALSLQTSALRVGRVPAVTLGDVVVFARAGADVDDPALWAHELKHVMQYADWGVDGFARRYLEDRGGVEHAANEFRWRWMKRVGDPRTAAPGARTEERPPRAARRGADYR